MQQPKTPTAPHQTLKAAKRKLEMIDEKRPKVVVQNRKNLVAKRPRITVPMAVRKNSKRKEDNYAVLCQLGKVSRNLTQ